MSMIYILHVHFSQVFKGYVLYFKNTKSDIWYLMAIETHAVFKSKLFMQSTDHNGV